MASPDLYQWIIDIVSEDPSTYEDAYWGVRPAPSIAVPAVLEQLGLRNDPYTRGKLLELLGECEDYSVLPTLEVEQQSLNGYIRGCAQRAIEALKRGDKWQQDPKYV